jgi:hypothetical protein
LESLQIERPNARRVNALLSRKTVMAGLVPAIHVLLAAVKKGVDARNKCGHDEI